MEASITFKKVAKIIKGETVLSDLNLGIEKGDRVVIYMPMVPEAVIAMLGCARIGAFHSVVFWRICIQ